MYDDPTTTPAADLAENPYWKRDVRRSYPKLSVINQSDAVGLLSVGSAANPKEEVLQIGEAGTKQLAEVKKEGEAGLATFLQKEKGAGKAVLGPNGLPPFPTSRHPQRKRYTLMEAEEQAYGSRCVFLQSGNVKRFTDARQLSLPDLHLDESRPNTGIGVAGLYIADKNHFHLFC